MKGIVAMSNFKNLAFRSVPTDFFFIREKLYSYTNLYIVGMLIKTISSYELKASLR